MISKQIETHIKELQGECSFYVFSVFNLYYGNIDIMHVITENISKTKCLFIIATTMQILMSHYLEASKRDLSSFPLLLFLVLYAETSVTL